MKRLALRVLIASVALSAVLGTWALLVGDFGYVQVKVLLTSLCISGASILTMAYVAAWDRAPHPLLPRAGMALAIGGFALVIVLMWAKSESKAAWKTAGSALLLATAAEHASLLGLATLQRRHRWLFPAAWTTTALLVALILAVIWGAWDEENVWRWVGVLSILLCAFTILIPVFQRVGRGAGPPLATSGARAVRFCPACGQGVEVDAACAACGARFSVRFEGSEAGAGEAS